MRWAARAVVAITSVLSGALHLDIWANHGYRSAPVRELFVLQGSAAIAAGVTVLMPRAGAAWPALLVNMASLIAFALSRTVGVPTLHGSFAETGLQPSGARLLGVSSTAVTLVVGVLAVVISLYLLFHREGAGSGPAADRREAQEADQAEDAESQTPTV